MSNSERFLWVCELNKDQPAKIWKSNELTEDDDEDDQDYVLHSLVVKQAVLGKDAIDSERNIVALKTKGYHDKEFEQPIFSLTLGRNEMISNMDLIISTRDNQNVEFKLIQGTGPVFITCMHVLEIPVAEENQTMMTTSDVEVEDDDEEEEEVEEEMHEENGKNGNGLKNGKNGVKNGAVKNGNGVLKNGKANGKVDVEHEAEELVDDKPRKRKRN